MLHNEFSSSSAGRKLLWEAPEEDKEIQEVTDKLAHADRGLVAMMLYCLIKIR